MSETDLVAARAAEPDVNLPEIKTTDATVASNVSLSNIQTNSSVRVAVRIRPNHVSASLSTESLDTTASHVIPKDMTTLTVVCPPPSANPSLFSDLQSSSAVISAAAEVLWEYDSVWNEQSDQDSLFKAEVSPLVNAFVEGFNATLFAYGQTGSGKTFTMGSSVPDMVLPSSPTKKTGILRPPQSGRTTPTPAPRGATASAPTTPSKTRFQPPTEPHPVSLSSLATTLGPTSEHFLTPTSGMIPRAIHQIFEKIAHLRDMESQTSSYTIKISFLELHNEEWIDLLKETQSRGSSGGSGTVGTFGKRPSTPSKNSKQADATNQEISIREDKDGRISIHGATSVVVASAEAALKLLAKGSKLRSTAATNMNESSSRSHAIFSVSLTTTQMVKAQPSWHTTAQKPLASTAGLTVTSKFHFVDLAGSERLKRTQNTGDRKAEGISINQGLLVLGRVINCLTETKGATEAVVPYRDSKLTRFLQDSLGGNSKTVMLACISALEQDLPETINTLRYASRARGIQNKSRITIDTSASSPEVVPLLTEIAALKSQLAVAALAQSTDQQLLRDLERENSELKKGEEKWRDEVLEGRKQCDELLVQVLELKMSAKGDHGMESRVWELESKLKVVEGENDYVKKLLKDTMDTKEQEVQSLKEVESCLQDSVRNMQTKVASLEDNLNLTRNENENLANKLREATVDLQTEKFLRNEMQAKIKDLEKSLAESQGRESGLSNMVKKIQVENESELNLRWSNIKALQEKNSESIKLIDNLEKELAESRAEIDLQKELHLKQTNSLKDEIASIKSNEQNLSRLLSDLQRKYEASETVGKTELDEVRNNLNLLTVENEKLVKELSERREHGSVEIQSLQVKLAEAQTISQKEASRNQALESRIKSLDFEIEALKQNVVLAETQTQAAVVQKEELKTQILNLQTERSFLESKHMSEIEVLQVEITKSQLEDAEQAANHAAKVEALKQTVELKTSQVEKAISEKEELDNRLLNLQSELTALESRHKTEHDQLTSKITKLQQLSTNQETQINSLTLQLSTKTTETTSLKTNLSTLETTTKTLHSTIKTLQTNLTTFHSTYTTLETQKQNLADMARQIPPLRASLTLTHRRASHTIKHLLTTISTLTQDRVAALQQVETLTRDLKARCGSVSKEGRVLETEAVWRGDDMFGRWCFDRGVGKENAVRMRVGEYERIRRERAERCGAGEGGGKGEGEGEVEDGLVERYQFLVNTVRGVREMFSE